MRVGTLAFLFSCLAAVEVFGAGCRMALGRLAANPHFHELEGYAAVEKDYHSGENIGSYDLAQGWSVDHDEKGEITRASLRVLVDNPHSHIEVTGEFNDWGRAFPNPVLHAEAADGVYFVGDVPGLRDGMTYQLIENGQRRIDPAAVQNTTPAWYQRFKPGASHDLNSIFYDLDKLKPEPAVDMRGHIHMLTEQALQNLIAKWPHNGRVGPPSQGETYRWFAESGIAQEIARGNNAVELMPQQGYIDGDQWQYQYQVFGRGPDSRFGTPAEFKMAVRALHQAGVAVILDIVPGHYPHDGNGGELRVKGLQTWESHWGRSLYGTTESPWGTYRYDFTNPYVRRYLVDNTMVMLKNFDIDGIRIDNVDGIRELPGGWDFLRELSGEVRKYRPEAYINDEGFSDLAPLQRRQDWGGQGADTTNGNEFFWQVIAPFIRGRSEDINMQAIRDALHKPFAWQTAMQMHFITNHDESGNGGSNFSGGFPAELLRGGGDFYTFSKIKLWNSMVSLMGSHSMDMLQVQLGQEGNMNNNPAVDWSLRDRPANHQLREYFVSLFQGVKDNPAFAAENADPNAEIHYDDNNKVLGIQRTDFATGKRTIVMLNFGHQQLDAYRVGIDFEANFHVLVDSDRREFGGTGAFQDKLPWPFFHSDAGSWNQKPHSLIIPTLAPFGVLVLQEQ